MDFERSRYSRIGLFPSFLGSWSHILILYIAFIIPIVCCCQHTDNVSSEEICGPVRSGSYGWINNQNRFWKTQSQTDWVQINIHHACSSTVQFLLLQFHLHSFANLLLCSDQLQEWFFIGKNLPSISFFVLLISQYCSVGVEQVIGR